MNNKELLIDFIEYAKSRHVMPILHSDIEPLVDDYLHQQNLQQCNVSGSLLLFKCKCGYETSNSVAWCIHADCCNGNDR